MLVISQWLFWISIGMVVIFHLLYAMVALYAMISEKTKMLERIDSFIEEDKKNV